MDITIHELQFIAYLLNILPSFSNHSDFCKNRGTKLYLNLIQRLLSMAFSCWTQSEVLASKSIQTTVRHILLSGTKKSLFRFSGRFLFLIYLVRSPDVAKVSVRPSALKSIWTFLVCFPFNPFLSSSKPSKLHGCDLCKDKNNTWFA